MRAKWSAVPVARRGPAGGAASCSFRPCGAARRRSRPDCGPRLPAKARVARRHARYRRPKAEGFAQRIGVSGRGIPRSASRSPPRTPSTSRTAARRRREAVGHRPSRSARCCAAKPARSVVRRSHLPSGCRRTTPEAVHGTSARMRSNGRAVPPRRQASPASPATMRTCGPSSRKPREVVAHARKPRCVGVERGEIDVGAARAGAWSCRPVRRRRRARACPFATPSSGAASCAPRSCTENAPASNPGSSCTGRGTSTMMPASPAGARADARLREARQQRLARRRARS